MPNTATSPARSARARFNASRAFLARAAIARPLTGAEHAALEAALAPETHSAICAEASQPIFEIA